MDAQRFGRALGAGTREVAKALVRAADAATAPNPQAGAAAGRREPRAGTAPRQGMTPGGGAQTVRRASTQGKEMMARMRTAGRTAGKQALAPVSRAAGVLWFQITGVFFGIFALGMGTEAWKQRAGLTVAGSFQGGSDVRLRAWGTLALALAFTWFTVSSFVRARRRERR